MIGGRQRRVTDPMAARLPRSQARCFRLAEAHDYAADSHCGPWQYAVEIDSLLAGGVTAIDLHWLVKSGYAEHAREVTRLSDEERVPRTAGGQLHQADLFRRDR